MFKCKDIEPFWKLFSGSVTERGNDSELLAGWPVATGDTKRPL